MENFNTATSETKKAKSFFSGPKIIFVILGIIVLGEFVYALKVLNSPLPPAPVQRKTVAPLSSAKISLNSPKLSYSLNEIVPVSVVVASGGRTLDGTDVIIHFDPKILEATSGAIVKGKTFDEYPLMTVDSKKGLVTVSGINSLKNGFKGAGQFIMINFKAKTTGKAAVVIDYKPGSTSDSNLVETETSKDILDGVDNLELIIQ